MDNQVKLRLSTYTKLIESLKELQLDDMADHLQNNVIDLNKNNETERSLTPTTDNSDCESLDSLDSDSIRDDYHKKLQVVEEPLIINVKKATKFRDRPIAKYITTYPMRSTPRGLVLIIANNLYKKQKDRRPSAKHDEANLKKLFEEMGFKVITYYDLTGEEIEKRIEEFSQMPDLKRVDSAFVIISSHGSGKFGHQETEILGIDYHSFGYKKIVCTKIMNYFTAENCRNLSGKPKIFIFQTCRGKKEQSAVPRHKIDTPNTSEAKVHEEHYVQFSETMRNYEDMLIVYSTMPGFVSYRDEFNGSWFIQILCEVFMNFAYKVHVQDLFNMIDTRLKNHRTPNDNCQTPSITSQGFNRYCYLNPGLFVEKESNKNDNINSGKIANVMFKCCPDKKANISICSHCESIYHKKCANLLNNVETANVIIKGKCCFPNINNDSNNEEVDNISLSENIEELKKVCDDLKSENNTLKNQISILNSQHENIISCEMTSKNSEQKLKIDNVMNENELLKQLNNELKNNNDLLKEKNDVLVCKLNKKKTKNQWVRRNFHKVLKKKRKKTSNTIKPVEI